MLQTLLEAEFAGYENLLFIGKVVADNDSMFDGRKLERIKVEIPGLYEGDNSLFPWCLPMKHSPFGQGAGYGTFGVPQIGSYVVVILQDGDPHYPYYDASILIDGNQIAEGGTNYPKRYGFKDPTGNYFYVDMTSGSVQIKLFHKSGTNLVINDNGSVNVTTVSNVTVNVTGNVTATVSGNVDATITGNLTSTSANATIIATATAIIQATSIILRNSGAALKKLVNDAFINLFNTHTHSGVSTGGGSTGAPNQTMSGTHTTQITQAE